jgi:hypothetical protein
MTTPRNRADDRIAAWTAATDRPIPAFAGRSPRRRGTGRLVVLTTVAVFILVGLVVGAVLTGGRVQKSTLEMAPSADLAMSAARALATAPGVSYTLTIATTDGGNSLGIRSSGDIDFEGGRFAGTADSGPDGPFMLLFGGPRSGALVKAGGLFVQTEGGPWVSVPNPNTQLDPFMDPVGMSNALANVLDVSFVDPEVRTAPCGTTTCRQVGVAVPAAALFALEKAFLGDSISPPPPDLQPVVAQALIDPSTGWLVGIETQTAAGTTTIHITLGLTRRDPAPAISPPIP